MAVLAGIVLYNPDIIRFSENINAVLPQVDKVICVDNNSNNFPEIFDCIKEIDKSNKIDILRNGKNLGIAAPLNAICRQAKKLGFDWVLTLDQDSVVPSNIVNEYMKHCDDDIGLISCIIKDDFLGYITQCDKTKDVEEIQLCITSASMINIDAWGEVKGFCDDMFIDSVDFDICFSLLENGYKIIRVNTIEIIHAIGKGKRVRFKGNDEMVFNHSPLRCYYIVRNSIYMGKRHKCLSYGYRLALKRFVLINLFERDRIRKDFFMLKGFFHAMINRWGPYSI